MVAECGKDAACGIFLIVSRILIAVEAVERWARDRRVWSGGGQAPACPRALMGLLQSSQQATSGHHMPCVLQVGNIIGYPCRVETPLASVAPNRAHPTLIRALAGAGAPDPSLDPACCGHDVPEAGPFCPSAFFSPPVDRPLATRPSADRVRPDWMVPVSVSGELGARRHETGFREPPECDE